ncbi:dienelactone hydrolase family protein [Acidisphaera rubrifaciens]|uniref:Dienelactone hydrolase/carboxymethylenebutenolidase n=1 Tax=Acidisphaera rubrifaciens HS-AP3 TaxID=1231350 RepID=A0A0D6P4F3_9PROT|nr:dienelactone hydrolase family protein [Acidisphaera rubrifaciens]GAN76088.1 dienelactone hydrolase/carboxymethylenebutenolidase [Acidisphaera rubrifaciens HS-AP3]
MTDDRDLAGTEADGVSRFPLGRRAVVTSGLISGFTLATARVEAQATHTDAAGIVAGETTIASGRDHLPAYYARPDGRGPFPTILVIEEIFGVHEYIKDVCRRLAHAGYAAVAPELYARIADLSKMTDAKAIIRDVILKAPDAQMLADLDAAARWSADVNHGDGGRLGVTGFCRGGRDTWLYAAHNPRLRAAVAWYGPIGGPRSPIQPRTASDMATKLNCPLLGLYGGQDKSIDIAEVQAAARHARRAGRIVEIVVYPDAPHGFHADYRPSYRAADARDGWQRMLDWFRRYGVS